MKIPFLGSILMSATGLVFTTCISMLSFNISAAGDFPPAALLEFSRMNDTLVFTVVSTGCTQKDHFKLMFTKHDNENNNSNTADDAQQILNVTLLRIKKDRCRKMPGPKVIQFDIQENQPHHGLIFINNPFITLRPRIRK